MESNESTPVNPVRPPAPWIGGKKRLAEVICPRLEAVPHRCYAEPFIGMGGIFFRRRWKPHVEIINDVNRELITLFRVLQRHHVEFVQMIRWRLASRAEFERLTATDPATLTDLERAARFLYVQRLAFGGKAAGRNFGITPGEGSNFDVTRLEPQLADLHERLAGVTIECLKWSEFIRRYDREDMLFYLDPPYWGGESDYGDGIFRSSDFTAMAQQLASLKGRFVMSVNDVAEIRRLFAAFRLEEVTTRYSVAGEDWTPARELLISNCDTTPARLL